MLHIYLFGHLRIMADGQPVKFTALPKTAPLWAYLLLHRDKPVPRDTLACTLWPDVADVEARANLRRHLHELRRVLPPASDAAPWLLGDAGRIQWNPAAGWWLDVAEFERLCAIPESLADAVTHYTGDLLENIYDDCIFFDRERLRNLHFSVLGRLVNECRNRGDLPGAIAYAEQILERDPLREDMARNLMALRCEIGDRVGALAEYRRLERTLRDEFGVTPIPETLAVYEQIRTGTGLTPMLVSAPGEPAPRPKPPPGEGSRLSGEGDSPAPSGRPGSTARGDTLPTQPTAAVPLSSFATFGDLLRYLRRRAGLTQRELAEKVNYSEAQISRLEQNHRLPDRATLLAKFVPALDLAGEPQMVARLLELAENARQERTPLKTVGPAKSAPLPPSPAPPSASTTERSPLRLPASLTALIGRERELAEIDRLLAAPAVRLITLAGPGGSGKTRLAVQAAADSYEQFAHGVVFVNLAPLTAAELVPSAVADVLNVREAPGRPMIETLIETLYGKQLLLVLDNFEHLLPAVGLVNDLLVACPGVKALVTSRETLRLRGEQVFNVPPLALPDLKKHPPVEVLAQAPAVALFVQRSQAVRPDFTLTDRNAAAVAQIVGRLDGLPLAIELAAARSRYLPPETLLARLVGTDDGRQAALSLLTGGSRDLPARQQTLRDTIAWSYALLEPAEQALFRRLALFASGFDLAAAEAVGEAWDRLGLAAEDGVAALLDKSLLYRVEPTGEQSDSQFAMLAVLREFALELLAQDDDSAAARSAFVAHYAGLAEQAAAGWRSARQNWWLNWLRAEEDNVRQALASSLGDDANRALTSQGVAILLGLDRYWRQMARITETRQWIGRGLAGRDRLSMEEEARLLTMAGFYTMLAGGEVAVVMDYHERALALACRVENDELMVDVLEPYGVDAAKARLNDRAIALVTEALSLERTLSGGISLRLAVLTNVLSTIYYSLGEYHRALTLLEEIVPYVRERGTMQQLCAMLTNVSNLARKLGDFDRDRACLAEVWQLERAQSDTMAQLHLLSAVAERVYVQGRAELAVCLHSAEQALARQLEFAFPPAYQQEFDEYIAELRGKLDAATFTAAWAAGEVLTMEEAIELGLTDSPPPRDSLSSQE